MRGEDRSGEKGESKVSIPIVTAASRARRSVQNSKGLFRDEIRLAQRTKTALVFFSRRYIRRKSGTLVRES